MDKDNGTNGTPLLTGTLAEHLASKPAPAQRKPRKPAPAQDPTPDETRAEASAHRARTAMVPVTRDALGPVSVQVPQHALDRLREVQAIGLVADLTASTDKQVRQAASVYRAALVNALTDCGFTLHQARTTATTPRK